MIHTPYGLPAADKGKGQQSDVVILDFYLPVMGGLSSARLIFPGTTILLHITHSNDLLEANASSYGVFRVVDETDGRNVVAIILDSNREKS